MRPLTASGLDIADACLGSAVLPQTDEDSEDAAAGRAFHVYLDTARKHGKERALAEAPDDEREAFAALNLEALPEGAEGEIALGLDMVTGEAVRYQLDGHRRYPADGKLHGTTDLIGMLTALVVYVGDYKRFQIRTRAAESLQLMVYALAGVALTGAEEAHVELLVPRSGGWFVDRARLDALDLESGADRIRTLLAAVAAARREYQERGTLPTLRIGPQCKICHARRDCPAYAKPLELVASVNFEALAADVLPAPEVIARRITALSLPERGRLYERLKGVIDIAELAIGILRDDARREPLPLSNGKELREVMWTQWVMSDEAKEKLGARRDELKTSGEIKPVKVPQVRPVAAKRRLPPPPAHRFVMSPRRREQLDEDPRCEAVLEDWCDGQCTETPCQNEATHSDAGEAFWCLPCATAAAVAVTPLSSKPETHRRLMAMALAAPDAASITDDMADVFDIDLDIDGPAPMGEGNQ